MKVLPRTEGEHRIGTAARHEQPDVARPAVLRVNFAGLRIDPRERPDPPILAKHQGNREPAAGIALGNGGRVDEPRGGELVARGVHHLHTRRVEAGSLRVDHLQCERSDVALEIAFDHALADECMRRRLEAGCRLGRGRAVDWRQSHHLAAWHEQHLRDGREAARLQQVVPRATRRLGSAAQAPAGGFLYLHKALERPRDFGSCLRHRRRRLAAVHAAVDCPAVLEGLMPHLARRIGGRGQLRAGRAVVDRVIVVEQPAEERGRVGDVGWLQLVRMPHDVDVVRWHEELARVAPAQLEEAEVAGDRTL